MMQPIKPDTALVQQPILRGRQNIAALWFPANWLEKPARESRILRHWQTGSRAYRFDEGDLLLYANALALNCSSVEGWPLRRQGKALCSAELTTEEANALPQSDIWLVLGAEVLALQLRDAQQLEPEHWINIENLVLLDTYDCSASLSAISLDLPDINQNVREILGGDIPPPSPEQLAFLQKMLALQQREISPGSGQSHGRKILDNLLSPPRGLGWIWLSLPTILLLIWIWASGSLIDLSFLAALFDGSSYHSPLAVLVALVILIRLILRHGNRKIQVAIQSASPAPSTNQTGSSIPTRRKHIGPQHWRKWLERLALTSQITRLLGRQQAAYVRHMLELFESGKLDEALRHAIPLGKDQPSLGPSFGTPGARKDLSLSIQSGAGLSISLGEDLNAHLRKLYRQSFEKLDREKRIDEAVFVLAELLQSRQEALDYLEKHDRLAQAADLALAWDMPAASIVRLYCASGNWKRALLVARRDDAYAAAVLQLEKKWPDAAARLRQEWATDLANKGEWLQAVDAIWPLENEREKATDWLLSAETAGGSLGARALVKRLVLLPERYEDCLERIANLRDDPDACGERHATVLAILALPQKNASLVRLIRILMNSLMVDQAARLGQLNRKQLQQLINISGDKLLQADLPHHTPLPEFQVRPLSNQSKPIYCQPPDAGSLAILDALALEDGNYLLAHGEAGVALVDQYAKRRYHFAIPAERMILGQSGKLVLALAKRDDIWRVTRLDLVNRSASDLGMLAFDYCAEEFNGSNWTICIDDKIRVLDIHRSLQSVLWQITDLPGKIISMSRCTQLEQFAIAEGNGISLWRYQLPQRRLLSREILQNAGAETATGDSLLLDPEGGLISYQLIHGDTGSSLAYKLLGTNHNLPLAGGKDSRVFFHPRRNYLLAGIEKEGQWALQLVRSQQAIISAHISWPADSTLSVRQCGTHWLLFDLQGRLLDIDTEASKTHSLSL